MAITQPKLFDRNESADGSLENEAPERICGWQFRKRDTGKNLWMAI
jgi:hypothetical protein